MKRARAFLPFAVILAAGCYAGAEETLGGAAVADGVDASKAPETPTLPRPKTEDATAVALPPEAGVATCATALPADIQTLLAPCVGCHSGPRARGGLMLENYAQVVAAAPEALVRMKDEAAPMPPTGIWPDAVRAPFDAWIAAGSPPARCALPDAGFPISVPDAASPTDSGHADAAGPDAATPDSGSTTRDAGSSDAGRPDAGPVDEFATPSVCTSGTTYRSGYGMRMHPGNACVSCHSAGGGPEFSLAGTVYPTAHEPDDCYGVNGPRVSARIVITDARGAVTNIPVNAYGNFAAPAGIAMPYTAKVVVGTKERRMRGAQTNGDCNSCHSESGASGAPGRILMPR